jgi:hypothetical protein
LFIEDLSQGTKRPVDPDEICQVGRESFGGPLEGRFVTVEPDHICSGLEQGQGVTASTEGEIRDPASGSGLEEPENFLEHHREVPGLSHLNARVRCSTAIARGQPAPVGH